MRATTGKKKRLRDSKTKDEAATRKRRVVLADDNPAIVEIVKDILSPSFEVVGAFNDGKAVLREAPLLKPDVVVLDISMGEPDGFEVARRLNRTSGHLKLVFLSIHEITEFIRTAMAAGGAAYVFKSRMKTDLIPAIDAACSGRVFVSCRN